MKRTTSVLAAFASAFLLTACPDDNGFEEAGETTDEAIEEAGEGIEEVGDEIGDEVDDLEDQ